MRRGARPGFVLWAPVLVVALAAADIRPVVAAPKKPAAADVQRAEELYDNGRKLYGEGSYEAAATAFEQAYELSGNLDMLYNAALAYDRADAFEQAISALDRYRALAPAGERDKLDERKRSLQARLAKQQETVAPATDDGHDATDDAATDAPYPVGAEPERTRVFGPAAWGLTGAAIGVLAIGTGFGAASLVRTRAGREHCIGGDAPLCDDGAKLDATRSRTYAIVADVAFSVGGALVVALVTVVAVEARRRKRASQDASARLHPHGSGVLVRF